jgi:hypothetical protein
LTIAAAPSGTVAAFLHHGDLNRFPRRIRGNRLR